VAKVTDEMLMAYADGALSPLARAKVEAFLQAHPEARRRIEIFRATGTPLSRLYGRPMAEPVPAYLKDFVLNHPLRGETAKTQTPKAGFARWFKGLQEETRLFTASLVRWLETPAPAARWQFAAASAAFLALGLGVGAYLHSDRASSDLVAFHDGRIYASGPLSDVLEKELSGRETRIAGLRGEAVTMRASLTFKSKENTYCREYEVESPSDGRFVGLGCRGSDGKWALEVNLSASNAVKGRIKTAGGADDTALDAIVDHMMDGDVFGKAQEAAAINSGWK
jgi:hypothetical protein